MPAADTSPSTDPGSDVRTGKLASGHPYARFGRGSRVVLAIPGLTLTGEPPTERELRPMLKAWLPAANAHDLEFVQIGRRGDLQPGMRAEEIADDYADVIRREFGRGVGVFGLSTGGAYAMWLAIRHPDLVDRLALAFTAHRLHPQTRVVQRRFADHVRDGRWRSAYALVGPVIYPGHRRLAAAAFWLLGPTLGGRPSNATVLPVDADAEEHHDATAQLREIGCPTLVASGDADPAYPAALVREMVTLIPGARHVAYPGVGHNPPAALATDVSAFLAARA